MAVPNRGCVVATSCPDGIEATIWPFSQLPSQLRLLAGLTLLPSACHDGIGTPDYIAYAARYPAYTRPCQRFAETLAGNCA